MTKQPRLGYLSPFSLDVKDLGHEFSTQILTLIFVLLDRVLLQEFIVNTPHPLAQKYWITNGAVHAKHVVVMAQLIVKGKNEGIHAILVRMRDNDLKTIPGVTIEDMGYKMGLNGVDNAKLSFDNVRVPRTALLNR